jgi:hypothetical protein
MHATGCDEATATDHARGVPAQVKVAIVAISGRRRSMTRRAGSRQRTAAFRAALRYEPGPKVNSESQRAWRWVPSLYFGQGLPYVTVTALSVILYKNLGISNTDIALYTSLAVPAVGDQAAVVAARRLVPDQAALDHRDASR